MCEADGSTTLASSEVLARSDGVHLRVESLLDEPASLNGFGLDVDPGVSTRVVGGAPGELEVACWPFSRHGGKEPATTPLTVVDPTGTYVSAEVECGDGMASSMIGDLAGAPFDDGPPPLDEVHAAIHGLREDDVLAYAGYPDDPGSVVVLRDGKVVASFGLVKMKQDSDWIAAGYTKCEEADLTV